MTKTFVSKHEKEVWHKPIGNQDSNIFKFKVFLHILYKNQTSLDASFDHFKTYPHEVQFNLVYFIRPRFDWKDKVLKLIAGPMVKKSSNFFVKKRV